MNDIHDIKDALVISAERGWWVWAAAGALLLLCAAAATWWYGRRLRQRIEQPASETRPSPETEAIARLDALAAEGGASDGKQFYFRLSAILRHYMVWRFGMPAEEMTMEELLPGVDRLPLPIDLSRRFKIFCRKAELIKFADAAVDAGQMPHDLAFVREFVHGTTRASDPAGSGTSAGGAVETLYYT